MLAKVSGIITVIVLTVMLIVGFTLISCSREPTPESRPFPTYFTHTSNGTQIRLGMTLNEMQKIWWHLPDYYELGYWNITITRNDAYEIFQISSYSPFWEIADGISVGGNIQNVIDQINGGVFANFWTVHLAESRAISIADSSENFKYVIFFIYDEDGNIEEIRLIDVLEENAWHQRRMGE